MTRYKLVLSDLDGTILLQDGSCSSNIKNAIKKLQQLKNIYVSAVTGRSFRDIGNTYKNIGLNDIGVFSGGSSIIDVKKGQTIWEKRLKKDIAQEVVNILIPYATIISYGDGKKRANEITLNSISSLCLSIWALIPIRHLNKVKLKLSQINNISTQINYKTIDGNYILQINHKEGDKYYGTKRLLDILDIDARDVLAIGDDNNDIPLFNAVDTAVAMGNAPDELKKNADYISRNVTNDGFVEAINRFILNS